MHHKSLLSFTALSLATLLSGCAFHPGNDAGTSGGGSSALAARVSGHVFGGQQPVSGATIQLYTVGTTGNGSAASPLLAGSVTSDAGGNFSIGGQYSCSGATQVYITATGGNAGSGPNSALSMIAALGSCAALQANAASTFININELTTVAAVNALAPFMADSTHIGAASTNAAGIAHAFAAAASLVSTQSGQIAAAPANVTLPSVQLNTLADILAACVNTTGASSAQCTTLFNATGATNTSGAALAILRNAGASAITALYSLASATPPFVPSLSAAPNDFTLAVKYAGSELLAPYGIAIDSNGSAWVTNEAGAAVTKLTVLSAPFASSSYTGGGLLAPRGISIDRTGNVWVANSGGNSVVKLSSAGAVLSGPGFTAGGINAPLAIATDSAGNAWVANFAGNSITELTSTGAAAAGSPITASVNEPTSIALDASGNVAVANSGTGAVCLFNNASVLQSCPGDGLLFGATAVAVSRTGALAMAGSTTGATVAGAFTLGTSSGAVSSASPVTGGGLTLPTAVAYDAAGVAWFANTASISAFNGVSALTPATGFGTLNAPQGIAVDASGNIWTANSGDNSVTIFVGLAAPTSTPVAANVGP